MCMSSYLLMMVPNHCNKVMEGSCHAVPPMGYQSYEKSTWSHLGSWYNNGYFLSELLVPMEIIWCVDTQAQQNCLL